jgi:hypothetical protein
MYPQSPNHPIASSEEIDDTARLMRYWSCASDVKRSSFLRKKAFIAENASSIGLKSGEYGGR